MRIRILLHSSTGNTKVVTKYTASSLIVSGHDCDVFDIGRHREPPDDMDEIELLGVACPTMYFRPTFAMERFIARLPPAPRPTPAFVLATCAGEPGAHFAIAAEMLRPKDYVVVGAHFVLAPSNWPIHIAAMKRTEPSTVVGTWLNFASRPLRPLWGTIWPHCQVPDAEDRLGLDAFIDRTLRQARVGQLDYAPLPNDLHRPLPTTNVAGRGFPREFLNTLGLTIDEVRCSRCGTCVLVCPVGVVNQASDDEVPRFERGCTGCYACYNRCPEVAISAAYTAVGEGQYKGPPRLMREVFRPPAS